MNLFPSLGSPYQEMNRFFECHHIRLGESRINYYLAQERKNRENKQHDYMGWLYSILIENGFDPHTNTKIEKKVKDTGRNYERENILRLKRIHNITFEDAQEMYFNKGKTKNKTSTLITITYLNSEAITFEQVEDCLSYICSTYNLVRHNAKTLYYRTLKKQVTNKFGFSIKKEKKTNK